MRRLALILPLIFLVGCSLQQAKTALSVLEQAAQLLCVGAKAEQVGVSPEEIREKVCQTHEELAPFLDAALVAQRAGAVKAGMAPLTPANSMPLKAVPELEQRK
jgi:hypothetical protein